MTNATKMSVLGVDLYGYAGAVGYSGADEHPQVGFFPAVPRNLRPSDLGPEGSKTACVLHHTGGVLAALEIGERQTLHEALDLSGSYEHEAGIETVVVVAAAPPEPAGVPLVALYKPRPARRPGKET